MKKLRNILIISLVLILSCAPLKKYNDLPEVKVWKGDIAKFEKLDSAESYPSDAILFAGSSSIRLWTDIKSDMAPWNVIQRGYGGAKLSDFAVYADRIFSPHPCQAAVFFVANDITGSTTDKTPEEVRKLFHIILKTFRKSHPATPFFYIEITPTPLRWKAWQEISKGNALVKEECQKHRNTYFITTAYAFLNEKGEPRSELFKSDKLHQNSDGYKIWSSIIKSDLDKVLKNK
jgi:hypothetical protein